MIAIFDGPVYRMILPVEFEKEIDFGIHTISELRHIVHSKISISLTCTFNYQC